MQIVEGGDQTLQPIAEVPENGSDSGSYQSQVKLVLWFCDISVRIRIRGSMPLINGSGFGSGLFSSLTCKTPTKN